VLEDAPVPLHVVVADVLTGGMSAFRGAGGRGGHGEPLGGLHLSQIAIGVLGC
jgi:hypothetical protein